MRVSLPPSPQCETERTSFLSVIYEMSDSHGATNNIATHHVHELKFRESFPQLSDSPDATRAHNAPVREFLQTPIRQAMLHHQAVRRVLPLKDRPQLASIGQRCRHVLETVHEHVHHVLLERDPRAPSSRAPSRRGGTAPATGSCRPLCS